MHRLKGTDVGNAKWVTLNKILYTLSEGDDKKGAFFFFFIEYFSQSCCF